MKKYKILEHKTDLKVRIFGKDRREFFLNALLAMAESQKPTIKNKEKVRRRIQVKSLDLPALLVDFLNEALYLSQVNKEIYVDVKFEKFSDKELKGEITGNKVERFGEDIKAATHHSLEIKQTKNKNWQATVIFDI
jgi:SHS2 domain-containing protein